MSVLQLRLFAATNRFNCETRALAILSLCGCIALGCTEVDGLTPPPGAPNIDLGIEQTVNVRSRAPGEFFVFTVSVRNLGPRVATGVLAGDTLPSGLTLVSYTTSIGTYSTTGATRGEWTIGTLAVNQEAILTTRASVNAGAPVGTLTKQAAVLSTDLNDSSLVNNLAGVVVNITAVVPPPPPPPPPGIVFSSNWSTATGNGDNAITDGGKWTDVYCQSRPDVVDVVPGAPLGWTRTPNVIRFRQIGPAICGGIEARNAVPQSTSHYGRTYFRNDENTGINQHALTYNLLGSIQVTIWGRQGSATGVRKFIRTYFGSNGSPAAWPNDAWYPTSELQNGVWYRYEWHMEYVTPNTYRLWPRIYSMAGTLLHDANNYFHNNTPPASGGTLAAWYAAGNTFGITDVALARNLGLTMEGQPSAANTGLGWYHADMALSTAGWIGQ